MTIKTSDGIDIYCLPDCAKCLFTGELVEMMDGLKKALKEL